MGPSRAGVPVTSCAERIPLRDPPQGKSRAANTLACCPAAGIKIENGTGSEIEVEIDVDRYKRRRNSLCICAVDSGSMSINYIDKPPTKKGRTTSAGPASVYT
ncbi:hypothetical protein EVAR_80345_1 [Eumeta japonica]|uniref:Uncharacterized protein n=1 Tax=Eumeta variegata TaxID=151549 RepID=A0A4C1X0V8_EUMVA|nr:hypothetical protein EVAR_80345_1 [Eumeta japonica]